VPARWKRAATTEGDMSGAVFLGIQVNLSLGRGHGGRKMKRIRQGRGSAASIRGTSRPPSEAALARPAQPFRRLWCRILMDNLTVAAASKLVQKLNLVSEEQIQEAMQDVPTGTDGELLLLALERKGYLTPFQTQKVLKGETDGYFLGGYRLLY